MSKLIAYCGLNCAECDGYKATQANDLEFMERIAAEWRVQYNSPNLGIETVTCDGCIGDGRHGGYCAECPVRACGIEHGVVNCAYCPDYGCDKLTMFFGMAPQARETLEAIRSAMV
ncbi:MAG: DUF3795 domain-containing protein [Chloroflexota bacterium]